MSDQNALELEEAIIATLLYDGSRFPEAAEFLNVTDFSINTLGQIFQIMCDLFDSNEQIDIVTIKERLKLTDTSGVDVSGPYLARLFDSCYTSAYLDSQVKAMLAQCRVRRLQKTMSESQLMIEEKLPIDDILEKHQRDVFDITGHRISDSVPISTFAGDLSAALQGVPTGFAGLDEFMLFENGNLIIVAGRPSMGKTALALSMAVEMARRAIPVLIFSLEMSSRDVMHRIAAQTEGLRLSDIRHGGLNEDQKARLDGQDATYPRLPIYINDHADWTPYSLRGEIRRVVRRYGIKAIFIDYMGLLHVNDMNSKYEEVTRISKELKSTAKTVGVPLIVLHQLNRASETRTDKRPSLADLRDSGAIEQDADIVIFPFRPSVYDDQLDPNAAQIIVAKHRQGLCTTVPAYWNGNFSAFYPSEARHKQLYFEHSNQVR